MTTAPHSMDHPHAAAGGLIERSYSKPVMRQTQTIMGLVLLAGAALIYFFGLIWLIVPAFMGVGLLVAGTSGICPMAMAVAKLPWNKNAGGEVAPCCER